MFFGNTNDSSWVCLIPSLWIVLLEQDWNLWMTFPQMRSQWSRVPQKDSLAGRLSWNQVSKITRVNKNTPRKNHMLWNFPSTLKNSLPPHCFSCNHVCLGFCYFFLISCNTPFPFHSSILHIVCGHIICPTASLMLFSFPEWSLSLCSPQKCHPIIILYEENKVKGNLVLFLSYKFASSSSASPGCLL